MTRDQPSFLQRMGPGPILFFMSLFLVLFLAGSWLRSNDPAQVAAIATTVLVLGAGLLHATRR